MNPKIISLALAWASAAGVSYFAFDTLVSLGDWGRVWASEPKILIVALLVTLIPTAAAWAGIVFIEQLKGRGILLKTFFITVFAWAWLYIGAIYLALLRLQ